MQLILTGVDRRDNCLKRLSKFSGGKVVKEWDGVSIPVIVGNNLGCGEIQVECRKKGIPYLYFDHAYFRRASDMSWARLCVSHYHCTDWRDSKRTPATKIHPWREGKGDKVVVLKPAEKVGSIYPVKQWFDNTMSLLPKYTNRKIVVKEKGVGDLCQTLQDAFAVVCYGSVGDVDTVRLGVPVFCGPTSPAYPMGQEDLSLIETPIYPDRQKWLRSLAASEWRHDEMSLAWERVKCLLALTPSCKPL